MSTLNSLVNMLLLFFVCIAYYLLIVNNFFQISVAIIGQITEYKEPEKITFEEYSMQWACIICALLCLATIFKTNIDPILKLIKFSIYCVIFYGIFILVNFIRLIKKISFDQI